MGSWKEGYEMAIYMVEYELNNTAGKASKDLVNTILAYGNWAKICKYSWVIMTNQSAAQVRENLDRFLDPNDKLFIAELTGHWASYGLPETVTDWLSG